MPSVLLGGFLGGSDGRTPLGQPDPETRTGRTTPKILTRKPGSDGQQPPRAGPTLSETKSRHVKHVIIVFAVFLLSALLLLTFCRPLQASAAW